MREWRDNAFVGCSPTVRRSGGRLLKVLAVTLVVLTIACNTERHYRILSFFFDGVPRPGETPVQQKPVISPQFIRDEFSGASVVNWPIHKPYLEKQCRKCHAQEQSFLITGPAGPLCEQCHDEFYAKLDSSERQHGPAAAGQCLLCHDPHESQIDHLLVRDEPELCAFCHTDQTLWFRDDHPEVKDGACLPCHDPHAGDRFLVRPDLPPDPASNEQQ
ncbi:MAG: hypothetical protein KDC38_08945 [Planctomycetes bacterium]|nr:hypothetical protein [Planctomycetota bacterium]